MKRVAGLSMMLVAALLVGGTAQAQVFTPTYTSPRLTNDIGVYLNSGPGDLGLEGIWRGGQLGLRVGYMDWRGGLISVGGEIRGPVMAPLALAFTLSGQVLAGENTGFGAQGGLTAGHTFMAPGLAITPYIHPRIGVVQMPQANADTDIRVLADIGVDVEFANNMIFRLGAGLGNTPAALGLGLAVRR
jgi:hypothetical protein